MHQGITARSPGAGARVPRNVLIITPVSDFTAQLRHSCQSPPLSLYIPLLPFPFLLLTTFLQCQSFTLFLPEPSSFHSFIPCIHSLSRLFVLHSFIDSFIHSLQPSVHLGRFFTELLLCQYHSTSVPIHISSFDILFEYLPNTPHQPFSTLSWSQTK